MPYVRKGGMWKHLKAWREFREKSLEQVANILDISHTTLLRWESGVHRVPAEKIKELARIYDCTPAELEYPPAERGTGQMLDHVLKLIQEKDPKALEAWIALGEFLPKRQ